MEYKFIICPTKCLVLITIKEEQSFQLGVLKSVCCGKNLRCLTLWVRLKLWKCFNEKKDRICIGIDRSHPLLSVGFKLPSPAYLCDKTISIFLICKVFWFPGHGSASENTGIQEGNFDILSSLVWNFLFQYTVNLNLKYINLYFLCPDAFRG